MDTVVPNPPKASQPDNHNPNPPSDFPTIVGKTGATLQHYSPLDAIEQALRRDLLEPAGIKPPRYVITVVGHDARLTRGGAQAKREPWAAPDGEVVQTVPIPREFFADRQKVMLSIVIGAVHLAVDSTDGYLSRKVVERLAVLGIKTKGEVNRYGGGKKAEPDVDVDGPLARWLASAPAELFTFFTAVVEAEPTKPPREKKERTAPETDKQLRLDRDLALNERNDAVARLDEVRAELDTTAKTVDELRPQLSTLRVLLSEKDDLLAAKDLEIAAKDREIADLQHKVNELVAMLAGTPKTKKAPKAKTANA